MMFCCLDRPMMRVLPTGTIPSPPVGTLQIFASARLDDRAALVRKLETGRHLTDQESILAAYERWGTDCPLHLIGDYAFVIIDQRQGHFFCARDHIGAKPFFYALNREHMLFAGSLPPMLSHDPSLNRLDDDVVVASIGGRRLPPADRTFYKDIHKLAPGHSLIVTREGAALNRYWDPAHAPDIHYTHDEDYVAAARELLDCAITDRLDRAKRPAVHISGGLDSSAVAATATRFLRDKDKADPIGYAWYRRSADEPESEESRWIEAIIESLNIETHALPTSVSDFTQLLRSDSTCGPKAGNVLPELAIQRHAAATGVDVILSGWGGDEGLSFNGRGYYPELFRSGQWGTLAQMSGGRNPLGLARGLRRCWVQAKGSKFSNPWSVDVRRSYIRREFVTQTCPVPQKNVSYKSSRAVMESLLELGHLTDRIDDWTASGAQYGIEYRYPLLDRRVLEFALGVPKHLFVKNNVRRWLMRQALDPVIPSVVRDNDSKIELARAKSVSKIRTEALRSLADEVAGAASHPRARYLDMDRLVADLRSDREDAVRGRSFQLVSVQFLGLA